MKFNKEKEKANQTDSKGGTALDLVALTRQIEFVKLLADNNGKCKIGNKAKLHATAKARNQHVDEYRSYIASSLN